MIFRAGNTTIDFQDGKILTESEVYCFIQRTHCSIGGNDDFVDGNLGKRIEKYDRYICKEIPLFKLNYGDYLLDDDKIMEYTDLRTPIPPILLDNHNNVEDGNHRCKAAEWNYDTSEEDVDIPMMRCFVPYSYRGKILAKWR